MNRNGFTMLELSKSSPLDAPLGVASSFGVMNMPTKFEAPDKKLVM